MFFFWSADLFKLYAFFCFFICRSEKRPLLTTTCFYWVSLCSLVRQPSNSTSCSSTSSFAFRTFFRFFFVLLAFLFSFASLSFLCQRPLVTTLEMVCVCSLAAGITNDSRICDGIMPAATRGFTVVLRDSIWFNLKIFFDGSLFAGVTDSS